MRDRNDSDKTTKSVIPRLVYAENPILRFIWHITQQYSPLHAAIPPNIGAHYRSAEMQFWNEDLPNLLRHPNKDISGSTRSRGPRPQILDFADGIGKYANNTANRKYESHDSGFVIINFVLCAFEILHRFIVINVISL